MKRCGLIRKRRACLESKRGREGREGGREWERLYLAIGLSQCYHGFKFHAFYDFLFSRKIFHPQPIGTSYYGTCERRGGALAIRFPSPVANN